MKWLALVLFIASSPVSAQSIGVAVRAGTTGPGLEVDGRITSRLAIRASGSYFPMEVARGMRRGGLSASMDGQLSAGAAGLTLDYRVLRRLQLSAGVWGLFGLGSAVLEPDDSEIGGVVIEAEDLGALVLQVSLPERPAPYLGVRTGAERGAVSVLLDLGVLFTGAPAFRLRGEGRLDATEAWSARLNQAFERVSWFPVAVIGIRYRIDAPGH